MVLRNKKPEMSSEQPVKKIRRTEEPDTVDEPDYMNGISSVDISLPSNFNQVNCSLNTHFNGILVDYRVNDCNGIDQENITIQPAPDICTLSSSHQDNHIVSCNSTFTSVTNHDRVDLDKFQSALIGQCLCCLSEILLRDPFDLHRSLGVNGIRATNLLEWPLDRLLQLLSNLQLLFDVYLKQNKVGYICSPIVDVCSALIDKQYNLIEQLLLLLDLRNAYVNYAVAHVISSLLIMTKTLSKTDEDHRWLENQIEIISTFLLHADYDKMNFGLEVIKRIVEWKDVEVHVLEEPSTSVEMLSTTQSSEQLGTNCVTIQRTDPESFETSAIKPFIIKVLGEKWLEITTRIRGLIENDCIKSQTCILTFLSLWESTISVKANLSVNETKSCNADLEKFASLLLGNPLPSIIWKQLLSLFNEILCYGSTLALQGMLPDETHKFAQEIVKYVKNWRLLDRLPYRCEENHTVHAFVGIIPQIHESQSRVDKTLLQKMVLLVLKSVAICVKETRPDSSDSSIGSDNYDYYQEMQIIERSIRDVLRKVDVFVKTCLEFHPETHFTKLVINFFSDQDDYMIESMICTLDIMVAISYPNAIFPDLADMINPVYAFIELLKLVCHDPSVLLDYLISNETCFFTYLYLFLKYIKRNWSKFVTSCECAGNELSNTMTVLIRLNLQLNRLVSKNLLSYSMFGRILNLLNVCENLFESNDSS